MKSSYGLCAAALVATVLVAIGNDQAQATEFAVLRQRFEQNPSPTSSAFSFGRATLDDTAQPATFDLTLGYELLSSPIVSAGVFGPAEPTTSVRSCSCSPTRRQAMVPARSPRAST
jgi:hypothetical protein